MTPQHIKTLLEAAFSGAHIEVESTDNVHFSAKVQAPQFAGLSRVAQQQRVYAALGDLITNGTIHALSLQTSVL